MAEPEPLIVPVVKLTKIINRTSQTIRAWERTGRLPDHLLPKRDYRSRRYWTYEQVFGENGIINWMISNDMRPGRLLSDPDNEEQHIKLLRMPKGLNGDQLRGARAMAENGRTRKFIIRKIYPRTNYTSEAGLERALVKAAKIQGWEMPPPTQPPRRKRAV